MSVREERLDTYNWTVRKRLEPVPPTAGEVPDGLVERTVLIFESKERTHRVLIVFDDDNRRALANALAAGVIVAP